MLPVAGGSVDGRRDGEYTGGAVAPGDIVAFL
jgi:hypothetical protein